MEVGTAITGAATSPETTLGSAPSMPATTIEHARLAELRQVVEQAVQPGHADVVDPLDVVAHQLGGDGGLLGHRQVGGAGADKADAASAPRRGVAPPSRPALSRGRRRRGRAPVSARIRRGRCGSPAGGPSARPASRRWRRSAPPSCPGPARPPAGCRAAPGGGRSWRSRGLRREGGAACRGRRRCRSVPRPPTCRRTRSACSSMLSPLRVRRCDTSEIIASVARRSPGAS